MRRAIPLVCGDACEPRFALANAARENYPYPERTTRLRRRAITAGCMMLDDRRIPVLLLLTTCLVAATGSAPASAAELDDAEALFKTGQYAECVDACAAAV